MKPHLALAALVCVLGGVGRAAADLAVTSYGAACSAMANDGIHDALSEGDAGPVALNFAEDLAAGPAEGKQVTTFVGTPGGFTLTSSGASRADAGSSATASSTYVVRFTTTAPSTYSIDGTIQASGGAAAGSIVQLLRKDAVGDPTVFHFGVLDVSGQASTKQSGALPAGDYILSLDCFAEARTGDPTKTAAFEVTVGIPGGAAPVGNVTGVVAFEKVPVTSHGLRIGRRQPRPAAGVRVEAVGSAGEILGSTATDDQGRYALSVVAAAPTPVRVRASAVTDGVEVRGVAGDGPYAIETAEFTLDPAVPVAKDLLAADADRSNGPFNLLFVARKCAAFVRSAQPGFAPPPLQFRWDADLPTPTRFSAHVGTEADAIFVSGQRTVNSDEFDDTIVAHEYGHFLAKNFSRIESPGGAHMVRRSLDPRFAWSEGWATFFGCAAMGSAVVRDTGPDGRLGGARTHDIEQNHVQHEPRGYVGEFSVASALWDVFDAHSDAGDGLALGFGPIWDAMRGGMPDERFVYLVDFFDVLYRSDTSRGPALRSILRTHGIAPAPGASPAASAPFPAPIASGRSVTMIADSTLPDPAPTIPPAPPRGSQGLDTSTRLFEFTLAAPGPVHILLTWSGIGVRPSDLDLFLLDEDGVSLTSSESHVASVVSEEIGGAPVLTLPAGRYVVEVASFQARTGGRFDYDRGRFTLTATY